AKYIITPVSPCAQSEIHNPQSSLLWGVIPRSGPGGVIRLFDSDGEFAEGAVAFFVGRVESEHVLSAQLFGEAGEGPVELFQRHFIGLFARVPSGRRLRSENIAAGLPGQRF